MSFYPAHQTDPRFSINLLSDLHNMPVFITLGKHVASVIVMHRRISGQNEFLGFVPEDAALKRAAVNNFISSYVQKTYN